MYKLTQDANIIQNTETGQFIPKGHRLWEDYQAWLDLGNTPCQCYEIEQEIVKQKQLISVGCKNSITNSKITSSTLGTIHYYDCREEDQANASMAYIEANALSTSCDIFCSSDGVNYEFKSHTAAQILEVIQAKKLHIKTQRDIKESKYSEIDAIIIDNYADEFEYVAAIRAVLW